MNCAGVTDEVLGARKAWIEITSRTDLQVLVLEAEIGAAFEQVGIGAILQARHVVLIGAQRPAGIAALLDDKRGVEKDAYLVSSLADEPEWVIPLLYQRHDPGRPKHVADVRLLVPARELLRPGYLPGGEGDGHITPPSHDAVPPSEPLRRLLPHERSCPSQRVPRCR